MTLEHGWRRERALVAASDIHPRESSIVEHRELNWSIGYPSRVEAAKLDDPERHLRRLQERIAAVLRWQLRILYQIFRHDLK